MKGKKEFLRARLIQFQLKIAELNHAMKKLDESFQSKEKGLYSDLFEVLDAFRNIEETIQAKEEKYDKTTRRLAKDIRAVHRKIIHILKANDVVQVQFPDNKAGMDSCKVVGTKESANLENENFYRQAGLYEREGG